MEKDVFYYFYVPYLWKTFPLHMSQWYALYCRIFSPNFTFLCLLVYILLYEELGGILFKLLSGKSETPALLN